MHDPEGDGGKGFNRSFSGLLVTCGLEHIRQPANGRPLHGRLPFTPARLLAHGEDWEAPQPMLFCEGEVVQSRYGGEMLRLRRRISAPVGGRTLTIQDIVTNDGAQSTPHALLYHINLGYPAVSDGTEVHLGERRVMGPLKLPDFDLQPEAASIPVARGETASCRLTTPSPEGPAFRLDLSFSASTLPFLQLWRDLRPHAGVVALEPCTSAREAGGASGPSRTQWSPAKQCATAWTSHLAEPPPPYSPLEILLPCREVCRTAFDPTPGALGPSPCLSRGATFSARAR